MSRQLKAKLEEQRKRLLDLTSRNKLLNYKHAGPNARSKRQSYLRIVDEIPEFIIERLESEKNFELIAKPKDKEYEVDLKLISEVESLWGGAHAITIIIIPAVNKISCKELIFPNIL